MPTKDPFVVLYDSKAAKVRHKLAELVALCDVRATLINNLSI
jgi:hypothetical protein